MSKVKKTKGKHRAGKISKYFTRSAVREEELVASDEEYGNVDKMANQVSDSEQLTTQVNTDPALKAMEDRLMAAIEGIATKLDSKVKEMKDDFAAKLGSMSITLKENCKKVADIEASVNFGHKEIDALKKENVQLVKKCKRLEEREMGAEKKLCDLQKELAEYKDQMTTSLNHIERRSREFNVRIKNFQSTSLHSYVNQVSDLLVEKKLVPENSTAKDVVEQIETAHPVKTKGHIIVRFHSRPYRNNVVQMAKRHLNNQTGNYGLKIVEDLTWMDHQQKIKAMPLMKKAFDEGKKVHFRRGILIVDGMKVPIPEDK